MIVYMSEHGLCDVIRGLEGNPNLTDEIIALKITSTFAPKMWAYIKEFGVEPVPNSLEWVSPQMGHMRLTLSENPWFAENLLRGVAVLQPLALTVESEDINALIPNRMIGSCVLREWGTVASQLERIDVSAVRPRIEDIATKIAFGPKQINDEYEATVHEIGYNEWLAENGKTDPSAMRHYREEQERQANEKREQDRRDAIERDFNRSSDSSFWVGPVKE